MTDQYPELRALRMLMLRPWRRFRLIYVQQMRIRCQRRALAQKEQAIARYKGERAWLLKLLRQANERAWNEAAKRVNTND
jgi:hypothetical protein